MAIRADITERKHAEEARLRLAAIVTSSEDAIISKTLEGIITSWNPGAMKMFGYTAEEAIGQPTTLLFPLELVVEEAEILARIGRGESVKHFDTVRVRKDGTQINVSVMISPVVDNEGKVIGAAKIARDITERKQVEAKLNESEERFRTMANSIPQLAWIAHVDGFIYWYNQRWYDYTGTTQDQMEGWGWQSVHDPEVLAKVMAGWTNAIAIGQAFEMEFPLRAADGQFRRFLTRAVPLKDAEGTVVQWFGTNTDVDELKRAEDEIRQLNAGLEQRVIERTAQLETSIQQLAAANKELEAFSYSVSHDLRAPLRAIDGYSRMVVEDYADKIDAEGQRMLGILCSESQRMGQLIDDLLAFSRIGRQQMVLSAIDMTALACSVFEKIAALSPERELRLDLHPLPPARGEVSMMRQVWVNLITNAIKFTKEREIAEIEIGANTTADGERIYYVKDNGAGFDMRFAGKLFGVFQRLHSEAEFEGTGVGLALVQRIVHRHGGRVWAEGAVDKGATFHFALPDPKPDFKDEQPS